MDQNAGCATTAPDGLEIHDVTRLGAWGWGVVLGALGALGALGCGSAAGVPPEETPAAAPVSPSARGPSASPLPTTPDVSSPAASPPPPAALGAPYPIVLLHGAAGFGTVDVATMDVAYFNGVREDLTARGESVFVTVAPPYASSEVRARAIATQIDAILARTNKAKVNLVGHSQGGLDARVLASPNGLGYGDRVASITTVSTPHRGSRVADASVGLLDAVPAWQLESVTNGFLTYLQRTVYDLQTDADLRAQVTQMSEKYMREVFNPTYVDDPRVVYRSYAGRTNLRTGTFACDDATYPNETLRVDATQPAFSATAMFLEEGVLLKVNDGMVTVESAKWGHFEQCVPADHLKQVGHVGIAATFDHVQLFRDIVARTRGSQL